MRDEIKYAKSNLNSLPQGMAVCCNFFWGNERSQLFYQNISSCDIKVSYYTRIYDVVLKENFYLLWKTVYHYITYGNWSKNIAPKESK